jgi:hypothetical protein
MGNLNAAAMAEAVGEGAVDLRPALSWHLQSNHFPPVPQSMIDPCLAAIEAAVDDDWDREVELPENISWRGQSTVPAAVLIEDHHLGFFVETAVYGDEEDEELS